MKILSPAISRLARLRWWRINQWLEDPLVSQLEVWQQVMAGVQYTRFGKEHDFSNILSIAEFQKKVPLHSYEKIQPYIHDMMQGEENILWNTPVEWFAKSSGTTDAKSKFIPVSYESLQENHFMASKDVLSFYYDINPNSDLLTGKGLVIGGSHQVHHYNNDIQYGDVSAVMMQNGPFWSHWLRTPGLDIALMSEWETKIEKMAEATMVENVTSLAGVPTWTIVLLKKILEKTGNATIAEVWPNLELYLNGGVNFAPYKEQFHQLIGKPIHYLEIYNASEGFFAAQNNLKEDGLLLFVNHGVFYEFILPEDLEEPNPKAYTLENVKLHQNYAMVISTFSGLIRYVIGDTVMFTSLSPYKIKVTGRTKHFINAFGEELIVDNADAAITSACKITGAIINDYTVAPVYFSNKENGAHEWLLEFEKEPESLDAFRFELDIALQNINSDYEAKRYKNLALRQPLLQIVPKGTFNNWLKSKGKLGGQHKVPRLSNNRTVLEEVKALMG